jgi:hypothetical protein
MAAVVTAVITASASPSTDEPSASASSNDVCAISKNAKSRRHMQRQHQK